jgi:hypothetical protein
MMRFIEDLDWRRVRPEGIFDLKVLRSGIVIENYRDHNLVVNGAFYQMARLISGDVTGRSVTKIGFGTGGTAPTVTDTALTGQFLREVSGYSYPEDGQVQINWVLPTSEGNGKKIIEFGLFTNDGMLFARKTRAQAIPKESDISLEGSWIIVF